MKTSKNLKVQLGQQIRKYRTYQGLSQEELAYRCGFDFGYLSRIESGKENLSLKLLSAIAFNLNVELQNLFIFTTQEDHLIISSSRHKFTQTNFGENVRLLRKQQNLTQIQFTEQSGINRTYLSEIESGKRNPTLEIMLKIADGLQIEIKELFYMN